MRSAGRLPDVTVVVGVDGSGRSRKLENLAVTTGYSIVRVDSPAFRTTAPDGSGGVVLVVDDAHRLDPETLTTLTAAVRAGVPTLMARRPTIERPELAILDDALAARGQVEVLTGLDPGQVAELVGEVTGRPCDPGTAEVVRQSSAGLPLVAVAVASTLLDGGGPAPALTARLQRRLVLLGAGRARLAHVLALRLDLADDVLAAASGTDPADLGPALVRLRDEGLLVPGAELMVPAVADALLADLPGGQRRRLHDDVARALVGAGAPAEETALQLRAARARGPVAAAAFVAAAEVNRFRAPEAALDWYAEALAAGAGENEIAPGRAEVGALLGLPVDEDRPGLDAPAATRLALAAGAVAAHEGRTGRAADELTAAGGVGPVLAVAPLVATGRLTEARAGEGPAPVAVRLLAAAALAATDPAEALPLAIEAAEAAERTPPDVVLPDTPHALAAVLAVTAGDAGTALHLLGRARAARLGGPGAEPRHRLLSAWARLRSGHPDAARAELRGLGGLGDDSELAGRDRVLAAAIRVGLARRAGDIAALRAAWPAVERVLARRGLDLFQLEAAEELLVAAARLRRSARAAPTVAALEAIVAGLGAPPAWVAALGWSHLQVAVATDDAKAARVAADRLLPIGPTAGPRPAALAAAARVWADVLAGEVDPGRVGDAADDLADVELPWEASRLAGDAAVRTRNANDARRLLERARDLAGPDPAGGSAGLLGQLAQLGPGGQAADPAQAAGLSEREVEVASLVLAGRTHKEIGAQLYIAPKTVEHHVARIRTKLGATSRAEFVAALRTLLGDAGGTPQ